MKGHNEILEFIINLEKNNNQSITFIMHGDGSGSFVDFWDNSIEVIVFHNIEQLEKFLNVGIVQYHKSTDLG
jgi:hypothetical protein